MFTHAVVAVRCSKISDKRQIKGSLMSEKDGGFSQIPKIGGENYP